MLRIALLCRFVGSRDGNYGTIAALVMVPLLTGGMGAVDYHMATKSAIEVQSSLDAAGLAVAERHISGTPLDQLSDYARSHFHAALPDWEELEASFEYDPAVDPGTLGAGANSLEGTLVEVRSSFVYRGLTGFSIDWPASRRSVVAIRNAGEPACVLALSPLAASAVKIHGTTDVTLDGCLIAANSRDSEAVSRAGDAVVTADCVTTPGGTTGLDSSNATLTCEEPLEGGRTVADPLSGISVPSFTACKNAPANAVKTLSPGTYCDNKWEGKITLETGVYILRGVDIQLGGNGSLIGNGVTIFLTENAKLTINGNQQVQLTAPTTGPYAGIAVFQEKGNSSPIKLNGNSGTKITGFIYAPDAEITFSGGADTSASAQCVRLIGNTVEMTGNSKLSGNCEGELGGREIAVARAVLLVR